MTSNLHSRAWRRYLSIYRARRLNSYESNFAEAPPGTVAGNVHQRQLHSVLASTTDTVSAGIVPTDLDEAQSYPIITASIQEQAVRDMDQEIVGSGRADDSDSDYNDATGWV